MAVKIRLARVGRKKKPCYRIVATDSRMPRDGRHLEIVGRYDPLCEPSLVEFDEEKTKKWLGRGAQPTSAVENLLKIAGISKKELTKEMDANGKH